MTETSVGYKYIIPQVPYVIRPENGRVPQDVATIAAGLSIDELRDLAALALDYAFKVRVHKDVNRANTNSMMWAAEDKLTDRAGRILDRVSHNEIFGSDDDDDPPY
jgi:hypothetical protein